MREGLGTGIGQKQGPPGETGCGEHVRMWAPEEEKMAKSVSGVWTLLDKQ